VNYSISDIYVFYVPTYVLLAVLVSLGMAAILDGANWALKRVGVVRAAKAIEVLGVLVLLPLFWPAARVVRSSWNAQRITFLDFINEFASYPYPVRTPNEPRRQARLVIGRVEDNALLLADWETVFTLAYVAHIEQRRDGITTVEWSAQRRLSASLRSYINTNLAQRPVYINRIPPDWPFDYTFTPVIDDPPLFRVVPPDSR
jgi:hypothetical protein